jgi:hypothetical protein
MLFGVKPFKSGFSTRPCRDRDMPAAVVDGRFS